MAPTIAALARALLATGRPLAQPTGTEDVWEALPLRKMNLIAIL